MDYQLKVREYRINNKLEMVFKAPNSLTSSSIQHPRYVKMHHPCKIGEDKTGSNLCTRPAKKKFNQVCTPAPRVKHIKPPPILPQLLSGELNFKK